MAQGFIGLVLLLGFLLARVECHHPTPSDFAPCTPNMEPGKLCSIPASQVHPTQFIVGYEEVKCKVVRY